jgi:nucleoside-diphosphate-sugar epimerase
LKKILVTGANGFVGKAVAHELLAQGFQVLCAARKPFVLESATSIRISSLEAVDWSPYLDGIDCIIHVAARAHFFNNAGHDPYQEYHKVNVLGTLNLAQQAAQQGIRRFIFISSIAVNGNQSSKPFLETDQPNPKQPYAISKFEAEQALISLSKKTGLEIVIIRPPLVYGPDAPGNFRSLLRGVLSNIPLPLGAVYNKRSLVAIDNLVSFILHCINHPKAANEIFLISDGEDVSTTELITKTALAFGKTPRLIPVPVGLMQFAAKLLGKGEVSRRLFGSLQIDNTKAREYLGWQPIISMDGQLQKIADVFRNEKTV